MQHSHDSLIPRNALFALLVAFFAVMLPHYSNVSAWLAISSVVIALLRVGIYKGWLPYPNARAKTLLVFIAIAAFYMTYRHQFSVETAVAFFVMSVSLKLIEVKFAKDCYLFVFILLYLCACQFLFSQTFITALYQISAAFVALSVLFSLHKGTLTIPRKVRVIEVTKLIMVAVPLVIAIFMFFPRIAPLWSIPLSTGKAYTGISDSMSPGQIAELTQSSARAFRVEFSGEIPAKSELYWRGLALDFLEGDTWRSSEYLARSFMGRLNEVRTDDTEGQPSYTVLIEPTDKKWAYGLAGSEVASSNIFMSERGYVRFKSNVIQPTRYKLSYDLGVLALNQQSSNTEAPVRALSAKEMKRYLQLPSTGNPQTRAFIKALLAKDLSQVELTEYLMSYFREQPFHYTLRPPRTSGAFFDDFMFSTQRGFCAHYAGSLVYMLRLAGIPSRVLVGYQGGEINEQEGYLMVHQYDAHAWVEVWHESTGWLRYDPTAMVAPDRIEQGLEEAVRDEGTFLSDNAFSSARYNRIELVRWMRLRLDSINYNWQKWVVGYDGQTQYKFLSRWLGDVSFKSLALIMAVLGGVMVTLAFVVLGYSKKRRTVDKVVLEFERFCSSLEKIGVKRAVGETPKQFTNRLVGRFPHHKKSLDYLSDCFYWLQYACDENKPDEVSLLKSMKEKRKTLVRDIKNRRLRTQKPA
ncbi:transglutaminase family protein [Alkalimarinus alittae]|uniref:TransglutaminaseTgpA domain-containing protein n=1 Tax=Alkalimarinus alittae TaxID=2961619 RepID=A0ABY6N6W3_9ALTE|nr:transglutaminaseTgpA domain-containing protein [Alkalimarinus alittae]UZE97836.1 transglutaminaseTgpA domain-containing protein [Alkalimarinus alittae]